jgi:hypothetical protein
MGYLHKGFTVAFACEWQGPFAQGLEVGALATIVNILVLSGFRMPF